MKRVLLLTGKPGTGKTALIKEAISKTKIKSGGFYTEERRTRGVRQGFRIITVNNQDAILAHVNVSSPYRVSKYKVDVDFTDDGYTRAWQYHHIDGQDTLNKSPNLAICMAIIEANK